MRDVQVVASAALTRRRPVQLVDCDVHPAMPRAMVMARVGERWRPYLERYGRRSAPVTEFYPRARNAGMRSDSWPSAPGSIPGSDRRLMVHQLLDEYDVDFAILNALGLQDCNEVPALAAEIARTYNDWLWEDWLTRDPRFLGSIVIPHEYPQLAVREIERRAADRRWVQVLMPSSAHEPLGSPKYWPIYEAAAACGLPVACHTGGIWLHEGAGWPSFYLEEHVANAIGMQAGLVSLVCEGALDAFPGLKVVLTEGGVGWAAATRWALDDGWAMLRDEVPHLGRRPSEYVRDQVWFTTQPVDEPDDPRDFLRVIEQAQLTDRLLFATDYPHWDFDSPTQSLPRGLSQDARTSVLAGNACALYRLPAEREVPAP